MKWGEGEKGFRLYPNKFQVVRGRRGGGHHIDMQNFKTQYISASSVIMNENVQIIMLQQL